MTDRDGKKWIRWLGISFVPRAIWLGIYWNIEQHYVDYGSDIVIDELTLFICLLPCLPMKVRMYFNEREEKV